MERLINFKNNLFASFLAKFKSNTLDVLLIITLISFSGLVILLGNITTAIIFLFLILIISRVVDGKVKISRAKNENNSLIIMIFALCIYNLLLVFGSLINVIVR